MPRLVQIDEYTRREIEKIKAYALDHPYDEVYRAKYLAGRALPVGDNPEHIVHIHQGYRAVYSISVIDKQSFHHLSISYSEKDQYPGLPEAELILELFGMGNSVKDLDNIWVEETNKAVNFLKGINNEQ
jgi:hypothetical protein